MKVEFPSDSFKSGGFGVSEFVNTNRNAFKPLLHTQLDSVFYSARNMNLRKNYYFWLKYKYRVVDQTDEAKLFIQFYDFEVNNKSLDSFKFIGNELWLYCD
jgi:hypothetical protein